MFGIGIIELFVIMLVALVVVGPDKLPEAGRFIGKAMRTAQQFFNEMRSHIIIDDEVENSNNIQQVKTQTSSDLLIDDKLLNGENLASAPQKKQPLKNVGDEKNSKHTANVKVANEVEIKPELENMAELENTPEIKVHSTVKPAGE